MNTKIPIYRECLNCFCLSSTYLCDKCVTKLVPYVKCAFCTGVCWCKYDSYALFEYASVREFILRLKYNREYVIGDMFASLAENMFDFSKDFIWTCVPTTTEKIVSRGYNASLVLCQSFCNVFGGRVHPFIFDKNTSNDKHSSLERSLEVLSIELIDTEITNQNICIVDDVVASGATLKRMISLLEPYTKNITCICIGKK